MGRIKTSFVKNIAKTLFETHGDKFTTDFTKNKEAIGKLVDMRSKKLTNTVVGYVTRLKKQKSI